MATQLYRVTEDDLAILESELPRLLESSSIACNDPIIRKRWQAVKEIVSNIRWDYGPPQQVGQISASPDSP